MLSHFMQIRVDETKSSGKTDFRYLATHDNHGDIASRGMCTKELQECKLWWHVPNWLSQDRGDWPIWNVYAVSK